MSGYKSAVFERDAHENRLGMRNWLKPLSPDVMLVFPDPSLGFTEKSRRTVLHLAAMEADVLSACELLRLGATVDKEDSDGITPLGLALLQLAPVKSSFALVSRANKAAAENALSRLAWVARILIEQHADVNRSVNDVPLLHLACASHSWDILSLMLKHGANPSPSPASHFPLRSDRKRFSALVESIGQGQSRPPRICPCWSGKTVSACHGKEEQPYPAEFICVCGSGKTYGRCCHSRKSFVIEKWDNESQRILHDYDRISKFPEPLREQFKNILAFSEETNELSRRLGMPECSFPFDVVEHHKKISTVLLSQGLIDPAYAYAMERATFLPQPLGRTRSRHLCQEMQVKWNALIDEYIRQSGDKRSKEDIERAAKIGTWNGALIRVCEGIGCKMAEGRDIEKLKFCAKCKISVYCSSKCQRSAWPTHKTVCGSDGQCEQSLPSQDAIRESTRTEMDRLLLEFDIERERAMLSEFLRACPTSED